MTDQDSHGRVAAGGAMAAVFALAWTVYPAFAASNTRAKTPNKAEASLVDPAPLPADAAHVIAVPVVKGSVKPSPKLTSDPWRQSACLTGLIEAGGIKSAGHPTWVYLCYDSTSLWVAFRCEGQDGTTLRQEISEHDGKVWRDDSVEIRLDPAGTCDKLFHVVINSAGHVYDALGMDSKWDLKGTIKTATDAKGWTAIVGIPYASVKAKAPRAGQAWAANFYRNVSVTAAEATHEVPFTKVRTAWVPGLINVESPDNYGRILFGPEDVPGVRMRLVSPMGIGKNHLMLDRLAGLRCGIVGRGDDGRIVFKTDREPADQGTVSFVIANDAARKIEVTLEDAKGNLLARNAYPLLSPEVAARAKTLPALAESIRAALPRFPARARDKAQQMLNEAVPSIEEIQRKVGAADQCTPAEWDELDRTVAQLALKLDDPVCLAMTREKLPQAEFAVGLESPMRKIMIRDFPFAGWFDDHYELGLARNEHEGMQVVAMPFERDLKDLTVTASPLAAADGAPVPGAKVEVSLVGHVDVVDTPPYKDITYHGWYPDPLLNFQQRCEAMAGDNVAFWIDVATAKDTPAGQYVSTITVSADGCQPVELRLDVTVWDFVLPDGTYLRNAFTFAEYTAANFYRERWNDEMLRKYHDFILDHRLNIDHLYRKDPPSIEVIKYGVSRGMNAFNVGGVFREAAASGKRNKELDNYIARLKEEGLFDYAYVYGFDEIREEKFAEMRMTFGNVHRMFPGLETMTTAADHSFGAKTRLRSAVDIWVPVTDWYDQEEARKLRKEKRDMWWYICVVPYHPYANFFVEYPGIEPRLLTGTMSYKYEAGGFLYYHISLWGEEEKGKENRSVISKGPYTEWNPGSFFNPKNSKTANGDGSLFCPGPDGPLSTIRMENIRDGFEDYNYLYRLRELADAVRKQPESEAGKAFLAEAERLLVVPDNVVTAVTEFSTDPVHLSNYRVALAAAILKGQSLVDVNAGP